MNSNHIYIYIYIYIYRLPRAAEAARLTKQSLDPDALPNSSVLFGQKCPYSPSQLSRQGAVTQHSLSNFVLLRHRQAMVQNLTSDPEVVHVRIFHETGAAWLFYLSTKLMGSQM